MSTFAELLTLSPTELASRVEKLEKLADMASIFVDDVMPQMGSICLQDYGNLNELCMAITDYKRGNSNA